MAPHKGEFSRQKLFFNKYSDKQMVEDSGDEIPTKKTVKFKTAKAVVKRTARGRILRQKVQCHICRSNYR